MKKYKVEEITPNSYNSKDSLEKILNEASVDGYELDHIYEIDCRVFVVLRKPDLTDRQIRAGIGNLMATGGMPKK